MRSTRPSSATSRALAARKRMATHVRDCEDQGDTGHSAMAGNGHTARSPLRRPRRRAESGPDASLDSTLMHCMRPGWSSQLQIECRSRISHVLEHMSAPTTRRRVPRNSGATLTSECGRTRAVRYGIPPPPSQLEAPPLCTHRKRGGEESQDLVFPRMTLGIGGVFWHSEAS